MSFPKYPEYKDSGVEWLGEVPAHWDVRRLKFVLSQITDRATERVNPVALENIEGWSGRYIEGESDYSGDGIAFRKGDILFGKLRPYLAKVYLPSGHGEAVGDFHVMRPCRNLSERYAFHQLLQPQFISVVDGATHGAKMPRVGWEVMGNMPFVTPPHHEQAHIATFLDHETARIDALVEEQQRLIELLKEKRQAVISHAVTKGLDPNVLMKDSGVEWLGEVPAHWDILPIWMIFELGRGRVISHSEILDSQGNYPVYSSQTERDGVMGRIDTYDFDGDYLTWTTDGANAGTVFRRSGRFNCTNVCGTLKPTRSDADLDYLWSSVSISTAAFIRHDINPKLMNGVMASIRIPVPPANEQKHIARHIAQVLSKMKPLANEAECLTARLQERRSALISAAVTGKIDVRGWQPPVGLTPAHQEARMEAV
jgi:type I restriction enzyme S subunit